MAARRSTCPTLPTREVVRDQVRRLHGCSISLPCFSNRRTATQERSTAAQGEWERAEAAYSDPVLNKPTEDVAQSKEEWRRTPPVPAPRARLTLVKQRRHLEENTDGEWTTDEELKAELGSLSSCTSDVPMPDINVAAHSTRPIPRPRTLKPKQRGLPEVAPLGVLFPMILIGEPKEPVRLVPTTYDDAWHMPKSWSYLVERSRQQECGTWLFKNEPTASGIFQYTRHDADTTSTPAREQADLPRGNMYYVAPNAKPQGPSPMRRGAQMAKRINQHTFLILSLVGVLMLCVWTFYSLGDITVHHSVRSVQGVHVGLEDPLTVFPEDVSLNSSLKNRYRSMIQARVRQFARGYGDEQEPGTAHRNDTLDE